MLDGDVQLPAPRSTRRFRLQQRLPRCVVAVDGFGHENRQADFLAIRLTGPTMALRCDDACRGMIDPDPQFG